MAESDSTAPTEPTSGQGDKLVRVMLADGPTLFRSAMATMLAGADEIEIVAAANGAEEALEAARSTAPDLIVYHPQATVSIGDAAALISELRGVHPSPSVIVLADDDDAASASQILAAGVVGYVLLSDETDSLLRALRSGTLEKPWISPHVAHSIAVVDREDLSARETQVVERVALGHTNSEIAEQLELSVRTVESHRANILRKLQVSTRAELVRYAIANGLLDTSR
jgi:two-component system response regulator NreC